MQKEMCWHLLSVVGVALKNSQHIIYTSLHKAGTKQDSEKLLLQEFEYLLNASY